MICRSVLAEQAARQAAGVITEAVAARGVANVMFATGNSQIGFVEELVGTAHEIPWKDVVVFHMDEYVGVGGSHPASFQRWDPGAHRGADTPQGGPLPRRQR